MVGMDRSLRKPTRRVGLLGNCRGSGTAALSFGHWARTNAGAASARPRNIGSMHLGVGTDRDLGISGRCIWVSPQIGTSGWVVEKCSQAGVPVQAGVGQAQRVPRRALARQTTQQPGHRGAYGVGCHFHGKSVKNGDFRVKIEENRSKTVIFWIFWAKTRSNRPLASPGASNGPKGPFSVPDKSRPAWVGILPENTGF